MIVGGVESCTVTVKVQVAMLFAASVALQVTVVVPRLNVEPEGGEPVHFARARWYCVRKSV
jgi:hypothetical protein